MLRAYRGQPCLGGGREWLSPANPDAAADDGHLHHETTGPQHGCAMSGCNRWAVTIRGSHPRNHAHRNRRSRGHWPLSAHRLQHADQVDLARRDHPEACTRMCYRGRHGAVRGQMSGLSGSAPRMAGASAS
jgi:hypothetical protein